MVNKRRNFCALTSFLTGISRHHLTEIGSKSQVTIATGKMSVLWVKGVSLAMAARRHDLGRMES